MENPFSKSNYNDATDTALIESVLIGDKKSLDFLLQRHQNFIYNVALKMLNNIADAEDVTQEILIKIVTQLGKYDKSKATVEQLKNAIAQTGYKIVDYKLLSDIK